LRKTVLVKFPAKLMILLPLPQQGWQRKAVDVGGRSRRWPRPSQKIPKAQI
jgi:hypothetical protein